MIRIWAKITQEEKILKDTIYEKFCQFNPENFYDYIAEICSELDIATPVILNYHINNYINFNNCTFVNRDFVESINFDKLIIEEASIK